MHKLVLSGVAALALLAIAVGGRAAPVALGQAGAARPVCHAAVADTAGAGGIQLAGDTQSTIQARRLLVADTVVEGSVQMPAKGVRAPC